MWTGIIKLHLLNPHIDGIALLTGIRIFIFHLEPQSSVGSLGKVCKSYNSIARNNNLSIKITNEALVGITAHDLFLDVLENSFRRGIILKLWTSKMVPLIITPTLSLLPLPSKKNTNPTSFYQPHNTRGSN